MGKAPPYVEIIKKNLLEDPAWGAYARGEGPMPDQPGSADLCAIWFLYIGDEERAVAASQVAAQYYERSYFQGTPEESRHIFHHLFSAALYWSLGQQETKARERWAQVVRHRRLIPELWLLQHHKANYWIYEAYALAKLGRYAEVHAPAQVGFDWLSKEKGVDKAPHRNALEYGLVAVLEALAAYQVEPTAERKQVAQQALVTYKQENVRYGKNGYKVIFDLQRSYPDVFTPILPGPRPEDD